MIYDNRRGLTRKTYFCKRWLFRSIVIIFTYLAYPCFIQQFTQCVFRGYKCITVFLLPEKRIIRNYCDTQMYPSLSLSTQILCFVRRCDNDVIIFLEKGRPASVNSYDKLPVSLMIESRPGVYIIHVFYMTALYIYICTYPVLLVYTIYRSQVCSSMLRRIHYWHTVKLVFAVDLLVGEKEFPIIK